MKLKSIGRRGQVMVLWALLIPVIMFFVGIGMDWAWYYLNVSRLQNAADAAALAGAQALVKKDAALKDFYIVSLRGNKLPNVFYTGNEYVDYYKNVTDYYQKLDLEDNLKNLNNTLIAGRSSAEKYTRINLSDDAEVTDPKEYSPVFKATNKWVSEKADDVTGNIYVVCDRDDAKN